MVSIGLDEKWEQKDIKATLFSVYEEEKEININNIYCKEQLDDNDVEMVKKLAQGLGMQLKLEFVPMPTKNKM